MRSSLIRKIRLVSGLIIFAYVSGHLLNLALGLWSLKAMDAARPMFLAPWQNPIGMILLYGSRVCEKTLNQALAAESADSGTWESLCLCLTAFADRNVSLSRSLDSFRSGRSTLI